MKVTSTHHKNSRWPIALAFLFALKVLIFSAGYPLFNTTDEFPNFDTALKQGRGYSYYDTTFTYDTLTLKISHEVQSKNYLLGEFQNPDFLDLLSLQYNTKWEDYLSIFSKITHQQAHSSPFYYATYGAIFYALPESWSPFAKVYTLRFLNSIFAFFLLWLIVKSLLIIFQNLWIGIAGGILLISIPQSIYYFINIDILSALTTAWCFYLTLKLIHRQTWLLVLAFGAISAFAVIIKASALIAVATCFMLILFSLKASSIVMKLKIMGAAFFSFILLLIPPFMHRLNAGVGLFATQRKIEILTWKEKAIEDYFPHILGTVSGINEFFMHSWKSWWSGESLWHGAPAYNDVWKVYFSIISLLFLAAFLSITWMNRKDRDLRQNMRYTSWTCILGYFLLFAYLSVKYDFGDCVYPSNFFPIFVSGRLMLGMLFPFIFLCIDTFTVFFKKPKKVLTYMLVFGVLHFAIELSVTGDVFSDNKNYFHQVLHF
ncbi:MAG: hypothetical protein CL843_03195 [Crocinitomicaceae bacterium]|nr:hypothetical protein [Crocinitomicaceae bacterium]|tara:strand:+ start:7384 stop:8844 length:1461 start_codon:yes stop_codon:yes gene_type:complete